MPREADISVNERQFIIEAFAEGIRMDDRALDEYRKLALVFGDERGNAEASLGKTKVAAQISAEVTTPYPDRKFEGIFTISTEFSPMASPAFEVGRPTMTETLVSRILEKTVRRSSALDTESLCLVAGSKCFHIRADIHVISHDGNILDTACIALMAALQHFRRPDVSVEGENVTAWKTTEREPIKLSLLHHPLCVSFSYLDSGVVSFIDASSIEEKVRDGEVQISVNRYGEVCQIAKYGGGTVEAAIILGWTKIAIERVRTFTALISEKLMEDERKRNVGDLIAELSAENER